MHSSNSCQYFVVTKPIRTRDCGYTSIEIIPSLGIIFRERRLLIEVLKESPLVHCDESPFVMSGEKDAADPKSKDYMWVYHSPGVEGSKKIYLYDYDNGSRSTEVIRNLLGDYAGIIVSDGYASYHTLAKENDNLTVAGCWVHCKRKYVDIAKTVTKNGKVSSAQQVAQEAVKRITAIFHADNLCKGKTPQEILDNRQQSVKPLVDAYFAWIKDIFENKIIASTNLKNALKYSINQEKYLRVFLENPIVPMSLNDVKNLETRINTGFLENYVSKMSAYLYS